MDNNNHCKRKANKELAGVSMKTLANTYNSLGGSQFSNIVYAQETNPKPTTQNYNDGSFNRYFAQKVNTSKIVEVSGNNYNDIGDVLYVKIQINWVLKGTKADVIVGDKKQSSGVSEQNTLTINDAEKFMRGIKNKLSNPLQYYKP